MGKRKKAAKKPSGPRRGEPLDTTFTCLFCHHDNSVTVRMNKKEGIAHLACRICDQRYQSKVNHLTEPIDVYAEYVDAADAAQKEEQASTSRRGNASSSRSMARPAPPDDDDD